jgi:hypothetical protein
MLGTPQASASTSCSAGTRKVCQRQERVVEEGPQGSNPNPLFSPAPAQPYARQVLPIASTHRMAYPCQHAAMMQCKQYHLCIIVQRTSRHDLNSLLHNIGNHV